MYACMYVGLDNETETMGNSFGGFTPIYADHIPHNIMGDIQYQSSKEYKLLLRVSLAHL